MISPPNGNGSSNGNGHHSGNGKHRPEPSPYSPKPPGERRRRRDDVARLLLAGKPVRAVMEICSKRHEVSATTIKRDVRWVQTRWAREDSKGVEMARARVRRRLERLADRAEKARDYQAAIRANLALAKIYGLILPPSVQVAIQNTVNVGERNDEAAELLRDREVANALSSAVERRAGRGPEPGPRLDPPSSN